MSADIEEESQELIKILKTLKKDAPAAFEALSWLCSDYMNWDPKLSWLFSFTDAGPLRSASDWEAVRSSDKTREEELDAVNETITALEEQLERINEEDQFVIRENDEALIKKLEFLKTKSDWSFPVSSMFPFL